MDLLPGAPLPTKKLHNISLPEKHAMKKYLIEALAAGLIHPSSSPVEAGFLLYIHESE